MDKQALKEEAKGLLLKGCYKMAKNKYQKLIQLGSEGFVQRDWAIIHLNLAISYQCLENYNQALQSSNRSIEIDPTYDKAYYRRLQILREMNLLEEALGSIPLWLKNKEIDSLLSQIKEEYLNSLGIDQIIEDLLSGKSKSDQLIKESHLKFYSRVIQFLEGPQNSDTNSLGSKISKYYELLKEDMSKGLALQSFLSIIHRLCVKSREENSIAIKCRSLLLQFWQKYSILASPMAQTNLNANQINWSNPEFSIVQYHQLCKNSIGLVRRLMNWIDQFSMQAFDKLIQIIQSIKHYQFESDQSYECYRGWILDLVLSWMERTQKQLCLESIPLLRKKITVADTIFAAFTNKQRPKLQIKQINILSVCLIRYSYLSNTNSIENTISATQVLAYLEDHISSFFTIYLYEQFIHRLDQSATKSIIPCIQEHIELFREVKNLQNHKHMSRFVKLQKQYELIYYSLVLKIDIKQGSFLNVEQLLLGTHNLKLYDACLSDICINALLLLVITNKYKITMILKHPHSLTTLLKNFLQSSFPEQLESVTALINFFYLLICDFEHQQEQIYANKMGVTVEQIHKVKKLQGESGNKEEEDKLKGKRSQFLSYICKNWQENLINFCLILVKINEKDIMIKMSKMLKQMVNIDPSKFYHPKIVELQLCTFKHAPLLSGQFLIKICKNINLQLFKYQEMQKIVDVLIYTLQNSDHQLVMFQSLLGLFNFSSNLSSKVKIPLEIIQKYLYEENQYIIHGALELINNILLEGFDEPTKKRLSEIVTKYIVYYRSLIIDCDSDQTPISDYSHPHKIYCTLLSLAIVLEMDTIQQFGNWKRLIIFYKQLKGNQRYITLFKLVIYMAMKDRLEGKWWIGLEDDIAELEKIDKQKWFKIKQYMR